MKKLFRTILTVLIACVSLICLFGCGDKGIEGKYLLDTAGGQSGWGQTTNIREQDENGNYVNVLQGVFVPEDFWVEIKGNTLTIHGIISPVSGGGNLKFNVADSERKIENFTLETSTVNKNWYAIIDSRGEDTLWQVLKDGEAMVFQFGQAGVTELWYSISYNRV